MGTTTSVHTKHRSTSHATKKHDDGAISTSVDMSTADKPTVSQFDGVMTPRFSLLSEKSSDARSEASSSLAAVLGAFGVGAGMAMFAGFFAGRRYERRSSYATLSI